MLEKAQIHFFTILNLPNMIEIINNKSQFSFPLFLYSTYFAEHAPAELEM
jgi:hypothetical protein